MKPKIAVDIDDVISDSTETIRLVVNNHLGIDLQPDDYRSVEADYWGYYEAVWQSKNVNVDYQEIEERLISKTNNHENMPLLAGAEFALGELSKKYSLILVTSRKQEKFQKSTDAWVRSNLPNLDLEVYFAGHKKDKSKGELCRDLDTKYLIDDNPVHCESAIKNGVNAILFGNYGWNKTAPTGVIRCESWPDVVDLLVNERAE